MSFVNRNFSTYQYQSREYAQKWTEGSIFCYQRGCNCPGCFVKDLIESQECEMKRAVFTLVRKFGAPPEPEEERYTETQKRIIDAILAGANNRNEIAKISGLKVEQIQSYLPTLYKLAEYDGVIYSNKRNKLGDFIKWVRKENDED